MHTRGVFRFQESEKPLAQIQLSGGGGNEDDVEDMIGGAQVQINPLDALLDQIDVVLEQNAEAFVQGFVQKGGQ